MVSFQVKATGEALSYQWQCSVDGGESWFDSSMSGSQTDTLTVMVNASRDGQKYRCRIKDSSGAAIYTTVVTMRMGAAPVITGQPESYTGAVGETAVFTVTATGKNLKYQWQYSNDGGASWHDSGMNGNKIASLSVGLTAYRSGQQYRCVITNEYGSVISEAAVLTAK